MAAVEAASVNTSIEPCSRCGAPREAPSHRWCNACKAAYMRANRPRHSELPDEARRRANCRAYTNVLIRRGQLKRGRCEVTGCKATRVQPHHIDYNDPWNVRWRCRQHHLVLHGKVAYQA